LKEVNQEPV